MQGEQIHPAYSLVYTCNAGIAWSRISLNYNDVSRVCEFLKIDPDKHVHKIKITQQLLDLIKRGTKLKIV